MKTGTGDAALLALVMGAVIFFCRAFPFLFFRTKKTEEDSTDSGGRRTAFLAFVEKTVPPAAMTVLAFNSITLPFKENLREGITALIAAVFTALVHLWGRNVLISIFTGTALFMLLSRILAQY